MPTNDNNAGHSWPRKIPFTPLPENGGTPVDEADSPLSDLEKTYLGAQHAKRVKNGDAQK